MVEDRNIFCVELYNFLAVGRYEGDVFKNLLVYVGVIDIYRLERRAENIAEDTYHAVFFFEYERRSCRSLSFRAGVFKRLQQSFKLAVELGTFFAFSRCADDDAEIARFDKFDKLAQT